MAPFSIFKFCRDQNTPIPIPPTRDLSGKTIIVTGANVGLGLETSRKLALMNPGKLILACRNVEKGEVARRDIELTTGFKALEVWQLDLANFASVRAFADKFDREGGGRLDILLQNAGIAVQTYEETKDGWESTLQVNHLGGALLAILLLPIMSKTPVDGPFPRITIVASEAHYLVTKMKESKSERVLEKLNDRKHCTSKVMNDRYPVTKLFNVLFNRALASRLPMDTHITVNSLTPGFCISELVRNAKGSTAFAAWMIHKTIARSTEVGARTLVHGVLSGTQKEMHGKFLNTCRVEEESDYAISAEGRKMEDRIWKETIEILQKVDPRVKDIVTQNLRST